MKDKVFWSVAIIATYLGCEGLLWAAPGLGRLNVEISLGVWGMISFAWLICLYVFCFQVLNHE